MLFKRSNKVSEEQVSEAIERLKTGSAEAFHLLYHNYSQKVYKFCLRMLSDTLAAEDAFQETFIRVYENRLNFKGTNFSAWLFTIARNTCFNHIRARKEEVEYDDLNHTETYSMDEDFGLKQHIDKAIALLPVALREALILREYEECTYQEIADIVGIDLSLAKIRVFRARLILRKILKPLVKELNES